MMAFLILFLHVLILPFKTQARLETEIVPVATSVERAASASSFETEA
jgi:hypothetical protein